MYKVELTNFIDPFVASIKTLREEYSFLKEKGVSRYLINMAEKHYYVNTFLYRVEKVKFLETYYPLSISFKNLKFDLSEPTTFFENYNKISITGYAGCGKSMLSRFVFLKCIENRYKIPILVELRKLNDIEISLKDYVFNQLLGLKIAPSEDHLLKVLENGGFVFLFDGFDEIHVDEKRRVILSLEEFMDFYSLNNYVITSRPNAGVEQLPRCFNFKVCSLNEEDQANFIGSLTIFAGCVN